MVSLGRFVTVQPPLPLQTEIEWHAPGVQVYGEPPQTPALQTSL
jgi:cytochrome c-type biogenesis protein CcmH/NrfF